MSTSTSSTPTASSPHPGVPHQCAVAACTHGGRTHNGWRDVPVRRGGCEREHEGGDAQKASPNEVTTGQRVSDVIVVQQVLWQLVSSFRLVYH